MGPRIPPLASGIGGKRRTILVGRGKASPEWERKGSVLVLSSWFLVLNPWFAVFSLLFTVEI